MCSRAGKVTDLSTDDFTRAKTAASDREFHFHIKRWRAVNYFLWLPLLGAACGTWGLWPVGACMAVSYGLGFVVGEL